MKNSKMNLTSTAVQVVHAYNTPQSIFEGIPVQYRSLFDFDVALIKELYQGREDDTKSVTLHKAYFEL